MSSNTKRKVSHYIFVLFVCFLAGMTNARAQAEPRDLKILEEHKDANGNTVRTIQYYQGSARVVETRIINQFKSLNAPVDPDTLDKDQMMVVITKSRFLLDVYYRRKKIRSYKVVFGPKPQENKMMKGDRRTPEGWYKVQEKHASARYHKFIHIDYPNDSARKRFEILKRQGAVPPNADIGGDVGIHGVWPGGETTIDMGMGWTDGCIAMKNTDVDDLYKILDTGVRIFIRK